MKTKNENVIYRQGDVLIQRIAKIPATAKRQRAKGRIILALGEATGHHHSLEKDSADWWKDGQDKDPVQYLDVKVSATVTHQEHAPIPLPKGKYQVTQQREYSPEEIRRVAD